MQLYLEWVKPGFEQPIDRAYLRRKTISISKNCYNYCILTCHLFLKRFIIYRKDQHDDICVKQFVPVTAINKIVLEEGEILKKVISAIRDAVNKPNKAKGRN